MSGFTFGEYVKPESVNPYTEVVADLAKASEVNPAASVSFAVPVEKVATERLKFGHAANAIDKTAKLVARDESGLKKAGKDEDGNDIFTGDVIVTFVLTKRHKARRGNKAVAAE